ncbi:MULTISPECIES: NADH-quinone oxidoreductase subunit C [unclassified Streptomyces]|uniref:NADH-quinone oxidoreductase subunit C n=1 Tax=unclassified Streptomyces TaxID=2593676 RepID=UPI0037FD802B
MSAYDSLPGGGAEIFGAEATAEEAYGLLTVDVPAGSWIASLEIARDKLGCTYFDWLSAVDEPGTGFRVCAHVVALEGHRVRRLLLRTTVPHSAPVLPSAVDIYAGAAWHERETHEMFGVDFENHPHLVPLLLPEGFEGHPLRKDFVLAARVAKAWPGAKEPGEPAAGAAHGGPKRRQMLPPGVPDPNEWGPLKGQLPPAPTRPARTPRTAGAGAGGADRPVRRARTASEGSASQAETPAAPETGEATAAPEAPAVRPRRTRSASEGSASQAAAVPEATPERPAAPTRPPASDAPWHNPKPAFTEEDSEPGPEAPEPGPAAEPEAGPSGTTGSTGSTDNGGTTGNAAEPTGPGPGPEADSDPTPTPTTGTPGGDPRE